MKKIIILLIVMMLSITMVLGWGATRTVSGSSVTIDVDVSRDDGKTLAEPRDHTIVEKFTGPVTPSTFTGAACSFAGGELTCLPLPSQANFKITYETTGAGTVTGIIAGSVVETGDALPNKKINPLSDNIPKVAKTCTPVCSDGEYCNTAAAAAACTTCTADDCSKKSECSTASVCIKTFADGEACSAAGDCTSGQCNSAGKCGSLTVSEGSPCATDNDCSALAGATCVDTKCSTAKKAECTIETAENDCAASTPYCIAGKCTAGVCGDNNLNPGETCDDGNTIGGDGCSADCQIEETVIPPSEDSITVSDVKVKAVLVSIKDALESSDSSFKKLVKIAAVLRGYFGESNVGGGSGPGTGKQVPTDTVTLNEGQTKTYNYGGYDYDVTLKSAEGDKALLKINGQDLPSLEEGDGSILPNTVQIDVVDIIEVSDEVFQVTIAFFGTHDASKIGGSTSNDGVTITQTCGPTCTATQYCDTSALAPVCMECPVTEAACTSTECKSSCTYTAVADPANNPTCKIDIDCGAGMYCTAGSCSPCNTIAPAVCSGHETQCPTECSN